jgi:hypothetical protein
MTVDVVVEEGTELVIRRARLIDRVASRLRASRLDQELARGATPEEGVGLALRARTLAQPAQGERLASSLDRLRVVARHTGASGVAVPLDRQAVRRADPELVLLIGRLRAGTVDVSGIAALRRLLADGTGPLYRRSPGRDLSREVAAATTPVGAA